MLPFRLIPFCKDYIWGGTNLKTGYGVQTDLPIVAEAWELSAHPGGQSVIGNGEFAGSTLGEAFARQPAIGGTNNSGKPVFPVLIKLIDAAQSLSIQVHPDDAYAEAAEGEPGKTEMWVILEHQEGAFLYFGFEREVTKEEFARRIADGTLPEVLRAVPVKKGDVFFIRAGTIHAIGAGIVLAEVQQNSDSTYRVFDFGRLGADGKPRPLHIEKALDVTELRPADTRAPGAAPQRAIPGGSLARLAGCPYFTVDQLDLDGRYEGTMDGSSFVSVLCTEGAARLEAGGAALDIAKGGSLFLPANLPGFTIAGKGRFLLTAV